MTALKTGSPTSDPLRDALRDETKRLIINCTYTMRGHFADNARLSRWDRWIGLPATLASALLSAGAGVSALIKSQPWVTFALAAAATLATAARAFLRLGEQAEAHGAKANQYLTLLNEVRFFLKVDLLDPRVELGDLTDRLREFWKRGDALNEAPPYGISSRSYQEAKRGIESGEASYTNDPLWKELDS